MNPQPTVFISSVISEFYDLRGALRYFLAKNGFRVLMSEETDFGVNCNKDSLPTCKEQIEKSDYLVMLIGNKPGTVFTLVDDKTTVTKEEFRHYLQLKKKGKNLHFLVFFRDQTWDNYINKDLTKIDQIQIDFIEEILSSSDEKVLGRWRYTFNKFSDIITVLESNQNGLFLDTTRKQSLYKSYLRKEILEIYRYFFSKKEEKLYSIVDSIKLPEIVFSNDLFKSEKINQETASMILVLIGFFKNKTDLVQKIQRVFIYIAQGEFSYFDRQDEKYVQPEFIKTIIQVGEMIEKIVHNYTYVDVYKKIQDRYLAVNSFDYITSAEYELFIKPSFSDIRIIMSKLTSLVVFFESKLTDLPKQSDKFYTYRGVIHDYIKSEELINYANAAFNNK